MTDSSARFAKRFKVHSRGITRRATARGRKITGVQTLSLQVDSPKEVVIRSKPAQPLSQSSEIGPFIHERAAFSVTRSSPPPSGRPGSQTESDQTPGAGKPLRAHGATQPFRLWPRAVSRAFRERLLTLYPALKDHEHAQSYLRLALYILFNADLDINSREILLPHTLVQDLVEDRRHALGHAAIDWIKNFSRDVFPLHVTDYRYTEGHARTVVPDVDDELLCMLRNGQARGEDGDRVDFVTGAPVSGREQRRRAKEYATFLRDRALSYAADKDHPAHELLQYLGTQSPNMLGRVLDENWSQVQQAVDALPESTERERARKNSCSLIMGRLNEFRQCHYISVQKTPRIFTTGATIHQLPREIRKVALRGATEHDLQACQLAIVAKLWDIGELQTFLTSGRSIWTELLEHLDLPASYKPIIKITIYSLIFGMGKRNLKNQLTRGDKANNGVGQEKAKLFFRHPLIAALLDARERQLISVQRYHGGRDAFGNWRPTFDIQQKRYQRDPSARSVLAAIVQSYELKLMLAMLPVLKANSQIYMLSWLHDGVTLKFGNSYKKQRQIKQLQRAIAKEARSMGVITALESTDL